MYMVTAVYNNGIEQCESEEEVVIVIVTEVDENTATAVQVYPNPTNGLLNVSGNGTMHITVSNLLGQTLNETMTEGNVTLDLSDYGQGFYLVRIATDKGVTVKKVEIKK